MFWKVFYKKKKHSSNWFLKEMWVSNAKELKHLNTLVMFSFVLIVRDCDIVAWRIYLGNIWQKGKGSRHFGVNDAEILHEVFYFVQFHISGKMDGVTVKLFWVLICVRGELGGWRSQESPWALHCRLIVVNIMRQNQIKPNISLNTTAPSSKAPLPSS